MLKEKLPKGAKVMPRPRYRSKPQTMKGEGAGTARCGRHVCVLQQLGRRRLRNGKSGCVTGNERRSLCSTACARSDCLYDAYMKVGTYAQKPLCEGRVDSADYSHDESKH